LKNKVDGNRICLNGFDFLYKNIFGFKLEHTSQSPNAQHSTLASIF